MSATVKSKNGGVIQRTDWWGVAVIFETLLIESLENECDGKK